MLAARDLEGRIAVVTGAGRGIGRAVASELAAAGARTVLVGRRRAQLESAALCIARSGGQADVLVADLRDSSYLSDLDSMAPVVDVVVNNASEYAPFALIEMSSDDDFAKVHAIVLDAARRLIQHVLPGMKARGYGRIVCVGSLAGELGGSGQAAYAVSKAALIGLTRTVAVEASAYGVTANVVQPGLIDTERVATAITRRVRDRIVGSVPARRIGTPEEVAYVVTFLASPRSSYVTGAVLPVSGGLGLGVFPTGEA